MSTTTAPEKVLLKEKLLAILKDNNLMPFVKGLEFYLYKYDLDNEFIEFKDKGQVLVDKIKQLIGERITDLMMYSDTEWAAAYVIVHKYQKIAELARTHQINMAKHEYNYKLIDTIKKMLSGLDFLIYDSIKQVKDSKDENVYYGVADVIGKANSIKEYLSEVMNKIEKENGEIFENAVTAKRELFKIIREILENL
jgi:hypothetical protein